MNADKLDSSEPSSPNRIGRRSLLVHQEIDLQLAIRSRRPDEIGLAQPAWSRAAIADLIKARTGLVVDRRSVDGYAIRWGFKTQRAYQAALQYSPERAQHWLDSKHRAFSVNVGKNKGRLRWLVVRELPPVSRSLNGYSPALAELRCDSIEVRLESASLSQWVVCERNNMAALEESILHMLLLDSAHVQSVLVVNCLPFAIDEALTRPELSMNSVQVAEVFGETSCSSVADLGRVDVDESASPLIEMSEVEQRVLLRDTCLTLTYRSRGTGKSACWTLDLADFWLPPSALNIKPTRLSDEPYLCALIAASANEYLTALGWSKSMEKCLTNACRTLIKLFEWSWVNEIYDPTKLVQAQFHDLLVRLSSSGWFGALEIEDRVKAHLAGLECSAAEKLLCEPRSRDRASLSTRFGSTFGTNLTAREMAPIRPLILTAAGRSEDRERKRKVRWAGSSEGMAYSYLRQSLTSINLLAAIDGPNRLPYVPYPNTRKLAEQYGRPAGRTPNLRPEHVGQLLLKSMSLVRQVGPPLSRLLGEYIGKVESSPPRPSRYDTDIHLLRSCASYQNTVSALGWDIDRWSGREEGGDETGTSLQVLIRDVYTAASTVVIFMNARRRDEVEHSEIGLYNGALRVFDARLSLYVVDFYVEKSIQDYATFFVSDFTVEAIQLLEQFSGLARRWRQVTERVGEAAKGHSMLMELVNLMPVGREQRLMYSFDCNPSGYAYHFIESVLGAELAHSFGPHMGRRAYALIFHYRYESGTLLALAQQFGSVSIDRLVTYVTDGVRQLGGFSARELGAQATVAMRTNLKEVIELESELDLVSKERVEELVRKVLLSGKAHGGPFQKLVLRFHQKIIGRVKYALSEPDAGTKAVSTALIDRGHRSTSYPHGNCYARMDSRRGQARCKDPKTGLPDAAKASLRTCTGCSYHDYQVAHIQATQQFIEIKMQRLDWLDDASMLAKTLRKEIEEDQQYLELRKRRLVSTSQTV